MAVFPGNLCKGSPCTLPGSLLVFVGCGFQRCPPGTEVAERAICLNCCTSQRESLVLPGQVWTDFSIAGIPRAGSCDLSGRQGEWESEWVSDWVTDWLTDWLPGSLLSPCSWTPPFWIHCRFALHFAPLILAKKQHGSFMTCAQSAQTSVFQLFSYTFGVLWGKRNKKGLWGTPPACSDLLQRCVQQVCVIPENTDY